MRRSKGSSTRAALTGFTGRQGVLIPASNVYHLMLRDDVVAAAAEGRFRIFPIETVDEGLNLLTGLPAGEPDAEGNYPIGSLNHNSPTSRVACLGSEKPRRSGRGFKDEATGLGDLVASPGKMTGSAR
jgi:hypothetical protein